MLRTGQLGANTSCLADVTLEEAIGIIRSLGFRGLCLLAFAGSRHSGGALAGFWWPDLLPGQRERLRALVSGFDMLAIHAPFDPPLFHYDRRVQLLARDRVREAVEAAGYLGAQVVIVHAHRRPYLAPQDYWEEMVHTFRDLGDFAARHRTRLGIETGYPDTVEDFVRLVQAVGHPVVGATLDTGHIRDYVPPPLRCTPEGARILNERLQAICRALGNGIVHVQLHDVTLSDWRDHHAIGKGVIDFQGLLKCLDSLGYQGMLELELEEPTQGAALAESRALLEGIILGL